MRTIEAWPTLPQETTDTVNRLFPKGAKHRSIDDDTTRYRATMGENYFFRACPHFTDCRRPGGSPFDAEYCGEKYDIKTRWLTAPLRGHYGCEIPAPDFDPNFVGWYVFVFCDGKRGIVAGRIHSSRFKRIMRVRPVGDPLYGGKGVTECETYVVTVDDLEGIPSAEEENAVGPVS